MAAPDERLNKLATDAAANYLASLTELQLAARVPEQHFVAGFFKGMALMAKLLKRRAEA